MGASPDSQAFAEKAIRLAWTHLADFVHNNNDESARHMARASHLAGKAINLSKTTACHAISYALSLQHHIPHGTALALTLGPMLRYNALATADDINDTRGLKYVQTTLLNLATILGFDSIDDADNAIEMFYHQLTGKRSAAELGIKTRNDIESIANHVNIERLSNNPRRVNRTAIIKILAQTHASPNAV